MASQRRAGWRRYLTTAATSAALIVAGFVSAPSAATAATVSTVGSIQGTVTLAGTPAPADSVEVIAGGDGVYMRVMVDAAGHYRFDGIGVPVYLSFTYYGSDDFVSRKLPDMVEVPATGTATVDVDLPHGAIISGRVTDAEGNPLAGVEVAAIGPEQPSARTRSDGTYSMRGLPAGEYVIRAYGPTYDYLMTFWGRNPVWPDPETITLSAGDRRADLDMTLHHPGTAAVQVVCDGCLPSSNYYVHLERLVDGPSGPAWRYEYASAEATLKEPARAVSGLYPGTLRAVIAGMAMGGETIGEPQVLLDRGSITFVIHVTRAQGIDRDYNEDGKADVVVRSSTGALYLYPGNGLGGFGARRLIGSGWSGFTSVFSPGDFTGDGKVDIMARTAKGALLLYAGTGSPGLRAGKQIGTGWARYNLLFSTKTAAVAARDPYGTVYYYEGTGKGGWSWGPSIIGSKWSAFTSVFSPGDFDGDGYPDVIARAKDGSLYLYRGTQTDALGSRRKIGSGWGSFTAVMSPGDLNGDHFPDVIARTATGALYLYPGNGSGGWLPRKLIGSGWSPYTFVQ